MTPWSSTFGILRRGAALAALVLLAAGCGGSALEVGGTTTVGATQPSPTTTPPPPAAGHVLVYLARDGRMAAVARTIPGTPAVAAAALRALLAGPAASERGEGLDTAIPDGTQLREVSLTNGIATVDLSSSFVSGAGTPTDRLRLAQVVYTLTQFPTVQGVRLELEGRPITAFGSGVDLSHAQTRADYEAVTPRILVESPTPGESIACPLRITGTSNDFESTFLAELWVGGSKVGSWPVMATSGNGTRGTFDATLCQRDGFLGPATSARLVVYEPSAENGQPLGRVVIPLVYR